MTKYQEFLSYFSQQDLVFSKKISNILHININHAKQIIFFYTKKKLLQKLYTGYYIFTKNKNPTTLLRYELACSLSWWYISWEHILSKNSIINADFSQTITCSSLQKDKIIKFAKYNTTIHIQHIKSKSFFSNPLWISFHKTYSIANPERALIDVRYSKGIYLNDNNEIIKIKILQNILNILPIKKRNELANHTQNTTFSLTQNNI